ncbi:hypothetical protein SDC9_81164 [bioreactor metagenome]|uniref:Uncharacterized protein n=1 Tax=bioreactor metagenome TaxID=1076179 RepID=A0A644Z2S5_9ZZZZ
MDAGDPDQIDGSLGGECEREGPGVVAGGAGQCVQRQADEQDADQAGDEAAHDHHAGAGADPLRRLGRPDVVERDVGTRATHRDRHDQHDQQPDRRRRRPQQRDRPGGHLDPDQGEREPGPVAGVAGGQSAHHRADRRRHGGAEGEQAAGQRGGVAQPGRQVRVAPHQREHHRGEAGGEVDPERQRGGRIAADRPDPGDDGRQRPGAVRMPPAGRRVAGEHCHQDGRDDRGGGGDEEGRAPAVRPEQGPERDSAEDLAEAADQAGQLGEDRDDPRREPRRDQPDDGVERHRVPQPDEDAPDDSDGEVVGGRDEQLAGGHHDRTGGDHDPGSQPVQDETDRDLGGRVDTELQHDEHRHEPGTHAEVLGGRDAGDAEGGALHDRHRVHEHPDRPHRPRSTTVHAPHRRIRRGHVPERGPATRVSS